jgi:hypothetical protein
VVTIIGRGAEVEGDMKFWGEFRRSRVKRVQELKSSKREEFTTEVAEGRRGRGEEGNGGVKEWKSGRAHSFCGGGRKGGAPFEAQGKPSRLFEWEAYGKNRGVQAEAYATGWLEDFYG